jgi:hypothetical protein
MLYIGITIVFLISGARSVEKWQRRDTLLSILISVLMIVIGYFGAVMTAYIVAGLFGGEPLLLPLS